MGFLLAVPRLVWELVGFVLLGLALLFGKGCYDRSVIENARKNAAVDSGTVHIVAARDTLKIKDSTVVHDVTRYHDVARAVVAAHPGDTSVAKLVQRCDQIVVSCADARRAAQAVIDSQGVQIERYKAMKAAALPRLSFTGEVLYDFAAKQLVPRAGVDYRLFSGLSVTAAAEAFEHTTKGRALAGLRFTFR